MTEETLLDDPDSDDDGLGDGEEHAYGTDPLMQDTDNDGFSDAIEIRFESDPLSAAAVPHCLLDIDANNQADALTDGILVVRYLFGFRGETLTNGAVDPSGARTGSSEISDYLEQCIAPTRIDIDDNNQADALSDGILAIRYLFGFHGEPLIDGAFDPAGDRTTAAEIERYLEGMLP
jgi:hypothetical protein